MNCKICNTNAIVLFSAKMLGKYNVAFHRCPNCGFIQTDEPYWLAESYVSAINDIDLGPVDRAIRGSRQIEGLILSAFDHNSKFVDYGAGYGIFVRLMRDKGFQFFWKDMYCVNLLAKHFEAHSGARYELLTAFEVFEHLIDPQDQIAKMLELSDNIAFTTLLVPQQLPRAPGDWWYFGLEHGQHVSFYTPRALESVAAKFGLHFCTDGRQLHLLSRKKVSKRLFRFFSQDSRLAAVARGFLRKKLGKQSLLQDDFQAVSGWRL